LFATKQSDMIIAVDFDGTIVDHEYPEIGKPKLFAFDTLKALQKQGHQLILWTYRSGDKLKEAVEFCRKNEVEFYAVNKSYPEEVFDESISRKIIADVYIDDRNVGGFLGWSKIWELLNPGLYNENLKTQLENLPKSESLVTRIKKLFKK